MMFGRLIPGLALALGLSAITVGTAYAGIKQWSDGFEGSGNAGYWVDGIGGVDHNLGFAHRGQNNGWVYARDGWSAIGTNVSTYPGAVCTVSAWIWATDQVTNGYMTVRSNLAPSYSVIHDIHVAGPGPVNPANGNYNNYVFQFTADSSDATFFVGFQGNGQDAWIRVDDVTVTCPTPF
jgi:hypothetical protein